MTQCEERRPVSDPTNRTHAERLDLARLNRQPQLAELSNEHLQTGRTTDPLVGVSASDQQLRARREHLPKRVDVTVLHCRIQP